jgi:hypothetical protein
VAIVEGPSRRGYVVGGVIAVVGVGIGAILVVTAFVGMFRRIDDFQRVQVPGQAELTLSDAGGYSVYAEDDGRVDGSGMVEVTIEAAGGGEPLALRPYGADVTYEWGSRRGHGLFTFEAPAAGTYLVTVDGDGGTLAIGRGLGAGFVGPVVSGLVLATVAFLVGGGILVATLVRRSGAKRAEPWSGPPGPGWGPPPPQQQRWGPPA